MDVFDEELISIFFQDNFSSSVVGKFEEEGGFSYSFAIQVGFGPWWIGAQNEDTFHAAEEEGGEKQGDFP